MIRLASLCLVLCSCLFSVQVPAASARTHVAAPSARKCQFRNQTWKVIADTAERLNGMYYINDDEVNADEAALRERLDRKLARYHYPRGYYSLESAFDDAWGHAHSYAFWERQNSADTDPSQEAYDQQQAANEQYAAQQAVGTLWVALKAMC